MPENNLTENGLTAGEEIERRELIRRALGYLLGDTDVKIDYVKKRYEELQGKRTDLPKTDIVQSDTKAALNPDINLGNEH